jgi:hypothetical protein
MFGDKTILEDEYKHEEVVEYERKNARKPTGRRRSSKLTVNAEKKLANGISVCAITGPNGWFGYSDQSAQA